MLSTATRGEVSQSYAYNSLSQLEEEHLKIDGRDFAMTYSYDHFGRLSQMQYPSHNGEPFALEYQYNTTGHLHRIVDGVDKTTPYWTALEQDAYGRHTQTLLGEQITHHRTWDGALMKESKVVGPGGVDQNLQWHHADGVNISHRVDNISGQTEFFQYDRLDRLKEWSVHAGVYDASTPQANDQPIEFDALQYDNIGNIIAKHSVGALTYDPQIRPHAVQFDGQFTYEYEANGNLIQGGGRSYVYDGFDLPTSIEHEGTITDFVYGANLRRVKKTVNDLEVTRYMGQLFEEREVTSAGQTQRTAIYHIHAPDGLIGQGQIDDDGNMSVKYLATDHLGSVTAQWDSDGNLEHRCSYTPFGERRHSAMGPFSSAPTDGFTGHEHDDSTGLINMVFRQYDPRTAQFVTPDPLLGSPFDPARLNPYTYAHHNPMRWVDPLGLQDGSIGSLDATISNDMYVNPGEDQTPIKKPTKPRRSAKSSRRTDKDVDDSSMENVLDGIQTTLDVFGLIPGLGEIADGTNALIYVGRGKYTDAALSVAAMVPFAGWFATGGKIGKKIIKYADDGVDAVADGTRAYKSQKAAQAAREHTQYIGCVGGTCRNGGCFVEGTPVATPKGSVSIEDVKVGDEVLCASQDQLDHASIK